MIFGRDKIVKRILKILLTKSILFVAERRVGKTIVLKELVKKSSDQRKIIFFDVEDVKTPIEFAEKLYSKLNTLLAKTGKAKKTKLLQSTKELLNSIRSPYLESKGYMGKDWKKLLNITIHEACNSVKGDLVLLFDEIPYMLQTIHINDKKQNQTNNNALEILDTLRKLRQENADLRMIYTGSIGLHHVVNEFKKQISTEPLNDMDLIELNPLTKEFAYIMAKHLLTDEEIEIESSEENTVILSIINQSDYIPFYIEKVIKRLALREETINLASVDEEIAIIITDSNDELEMKHYRTRLEPYYQGMIQLTDGTETTREKITTSLLDNIAIADRNLSINDCNKQIKSEYPFDDKKLIIELLDSLAKDYYIKADINMEYQFTYTLIKRWWIKNQGLTANIKKARNND